jgi:hypothetical protein
MSDDNQNNTFGAIPLPPIPFANERLWNLFKKVWATGALPPPNYTSLYLKMTAS